MTLKKIVQQYPCFLVLLAPQKRDDAGWVKDWTVLGTARDVSGCERALEYYEREGVPGAVVFSTYTDESGIQAPEMPPRHAAKFWRVFYGMEGGINDNGCSCPR